MNIKLLTEHHLEFLSLKGGCTGSSESIIVKMPHCWISHVMAQLSMSGKPLSHITQPPMSSGGNDMTRNVKKTYKFGVICDERCNKLVKIHVSTDTCTKNKKDICLHKIVTC